MTLSEDRQEANINEENLIKRVEDAARKGAKDGAKSGGGTNQSTIWLIVIVAILIIGALVYLNYILDSKWAGFLQEAREEFTFGKTKEDHDLLVEDDGLIGFTAADFAEAILGDSSQLKKLEVYEQDVADVVTITDTGLANIKVFEKTQVITYHGTATYTVDLSGLGKQDVSLDEDNKTITLYIPHSVRENINIPEDQMEFGDVSKGLLAFGDIKLTPEQNAKIQSAAREKMENKLVETGAVDQADRFAKMSVWEIYQSVVSGVSPEYTLSVEFK